MNRWNTIHSTQLPAGKIESVQRAVNSFPNTGAGFRGMAPIDPAGRLMIAGDITGTKPGRGGSRNGSGEPATDHGRRFRFVGRPGDRVGAFNGTGRCLGGTRTGEPDLWPARRRLRDRVFPDRG